MVRSSPFSNPGGSRRCCPGMGNCRMEKPGQATEAGCCIRCCCLQGLAENSEAGLLFGVGCYKRMESVVSVEMLNIFVINMIAYYKNVVFSGGR